MSDATPPLTAARRVPSGAATRRTLLLGGAGLALAGCETIDSIFGESKKPLPGDRQSVLQAAGNISADPAAASRPVTLPAPANPAEWPQAGGNLAHNPGHVATGGSLREAWRSSIGDGSGYRQRITAGPIATADTVFTADAFAEVSAFDLARGGRRWRVDSKPPRESAGVAGAGLAFDGGVLYAATGAAEVLAMDPSTGEVRWRARTPAPARGAPTVAGGRIFVTTLENHLLALSTEDGRTLWTYRGQQVLAIPLGLPSAAVVGETVVAGFPSGELVALRAADGRVQWSEGVSGGPGSRRGGIAELGGITGLPVVAEERVIATGMGGTILSVDLRSGRRLWERDVGSATTPAVAGDWVFLTSTGGELVALSRLDGRIRWVSALDNRPENRRRRDPATFGPPMLAGGQILVPSSLGEIVVADPAEGAVTARIRTAGPATLPMAAVNGTILAITDDGSLTAFRGA
ncbi:PQQ-binding-like beta-propeller repeat protein [Roseomonas sp. CCTCC AB2023176]|uniref:outer membrane protein assembly factor BamB family protein n=1 Tax=Roseomonas sp. CCTCC AB2023176 TaxID=3342640 RepID=UPI0035D81AE4